MAALKAELCCSFSETYNARSAYKKTHRDSVESDFSSIFRLIRVSLVDAFISTKVQKKCEILLADKNRRQYTASVRRWLTIQSLTVPSMRQNLEDYSHILVAKRLISTKSRKESAEQPLAREQPRRFVNVGTSDERGRVTITAKDHNVVTPIKPYCCRCAGRK